MFINTCSEWNSTACNMFNVTKMAPAMRNIEAVSSPRFMAWGDGGISGPRMATLQFPNAVQMHIWKLAAA